MELTAATVALALAKAGGPRAAAAAYQRIAPKDWAERLTAAALRKEPRPRPRRALARLLRRDLMLERLIEAVAGDTGVDPALVTDVDAGLGRSWRWRRLPAEDRRSRAARVSRQVVAEFVSALDPARAVAVTSVATRQAISDLNVKLDGQRELLTTAVAEHDAGGAKGLLARLREQWVTLPTVTHAELETGLEADPEGITQLVAAVTVPSSSPAQTLRDWVQGPPRWLGTASGPERPVVWSAMGELAWAYGLAVQSSVAFEAAAMASAGESRSYLLARAAWAAHLEQDDERVASLLTAAGDRASHAALRVVAALHALRPGSLPASGGDTASAIVSESGAAAGPGTRPGRAVIGPAPQSIAVSTHRRALARAALAAWPVTRPVDRDMWARAAALLELTDESRPMANRYNAAVGILNGVLADGWIDATALILARMLSAQAHTGAATDRAGDLRRAEELAVRVRGAARAARADSRAAVRAAVAAAGQGNRLARVIQLGSRDFGEATAEEAGDPEVFRHVVMAAVQSAPGIADALVERLDDALPDGYLRCWARAALAERHTVPEPSREMRLELWQAALTAATSDDERREAVRGLAFAGAADLPGLDDLLADAPWMAAEWRAASALARGDAAEAVRLLHPHRLASVTAAGVLADAYAALGQIDAAVETLSAAAGKFDVDDLLGRAAALRADAGDKEDAEQILAGVLGTASPDWAGRSQALDLIGMLQADRGDWASAVSSWRSAVEADPRSATARWHLAGALAGRGEHAEAWTVLTGGHDLDLQTPVPLDPPTAAAARLLLVLAARYSNITVLISKGLELLDRFRDDSDFVGRTLVLLLGVRAADSEPGTDDEAIDHHGEDHRLEGGTTVVSSDGKARLGGELSERLNQAVAAYASANPDSPYLQAISGTTDELVAAMNARGRPDPELHDATTDALLAVQRGHMPLGVLVGLVGKLYAEEVVSHEAGVLTAVSDKAEHQAGTLDALDVLGVRATGAGRTGPPGSSLLSAVTIPTAEVVIDATTLYVRSLLPELDALLAGGLREIVLSEEAYLDVIASRDHLALPVVGSWTVDPVSGDGYFVSLPPTTLTMRRSRMAAVADLAHACRRLPTPVAPSPQLEQIYDQRFAAWTTGLRLAASRGAALWVDDVGVRALARRLGVLTFSTVALLDAYGHIQRIQPVQREDAVGALVCGYVGDFAPDAPRLRGLAAEGSDSRGAVLSAISKPTFWLDFAAAAFAYERLAADFAATCPDVVADLVHVALLGVRRLGLTAGAMGERTSALLAGAIDAVPTPTEVPRLLAAARMAFRDTPEQPNLLPAATLRLLGRHERRFDAPFAAAAVRALFATCSAEDQRIVAGVILGPRIPPRH